MHRGEISHNFQISVVLLFDLLPKRAYRSQGKGGPHCTGCPWMRCLWVNPFLSILFFTSQETSQHKHTAMVIQTHTQKPTERDVLLLEWWCEAKVMQYHSFIPIIPCVGWVRGLLMASTLRKGSTALTYTLETLTAHSPPPCVKSTAHGLYNPSTWLIRLQ